MKQNLNFLKLFLFSVFCGLIGTLVAIYLEFFLIKKEFTIEIKKGDNAYILSKKLYKNDLIRCENCFLYLNVLLDKLGLFFLKEGEYEFENKRLSEFFDKIKNNKTKKYPIQITEGLTLKQIELIVNNCIVLSGNISNETKKLIREGYFMPDTYFVEKNFSRDEFMKLGYKNMNLFLEEMSTIWQVKKTQGHFLKNINDVLILASIVEAETPIAEERNEVAGVYLHRLQIGMPLAADPVIIYFVTNKEICGQFKLYHKHLAMQNEYNVYKNIGLPPTPICSPSRESILAVLNANKTENLFFVAKGNGGHFFSKTFDEHKENIKVYKENLKKLKA